MAQQGPPVQYTPTTFSFPSPNLQTPHLQAFQDAVTHAKNVMRAYEPAVLRQAIRELWETAVVGSDYHCSFLCSTMFHRAPPATLSRTVEQHGARLVKNSATQIAKHLKSEDLDSIAHLLMPKLSPEFLDKALSLRLESIQAQQLVNALGRAERLGYDVRDVVTGNQSGPARHERVIPTANPIPAPPTSMVAAASRAPQTPQQAAPSSPATHSLPPDAEVIRLGIAFCDRCNRPCGGPKALLSHQRSGLCGSQPVPLEKFGRQFCLFCGQRFVGNGGLLYHMNNRVCGQHTDDHADVLMRLFRDAESVWRQKQPIGSAKSDRPVTSPSTPRAAEDNKDPYAHLEPNARLALEVALKRIEHQYAEGQKKAMHLPPDLQRAELARLKNLYSNKTSTTRKKFGIRLRERRTRAEIEHERGRLLSSRLSTPASTGDRARSEMAESPLLTRGRASSEVDGHTTSTGERDSKSRQGTPKGEPATEMGNDVPMSTGTGERTGPIRLPAAAPAASQPNMPGPSGAVARPVPMSIAGSYTKPIQAPTAPLSKAQDSAPIEIDDDGNESATEMDVDGHEDGTD
ncbi:hypothetical protein V2A60_007790 [Cordyceps javanica]|uniref:Uncharacterized protein n=1 Tax=Cordyceps javanica TaxID=43265 RepID=A0A545W6S0_9HYPO|nr:hypothetical protein IF1G_02552 [Cordyceps javanica]TQW09689.1 hypothetical protein IF2G_02479 [Cordyceps javanica]